jgi:hypothetical protein
VVIKEKQIEARKISAIEDYEKNAPEINFEILSRDMFSLQLRECFTFLDL